MELELPEIVALVRDIAFLALLLLFLLLGLAMYLKVSAAAKTFRRTSETITDVLSRISQTFAEPPPKRSRMGSGVRNVGTAVRWLIRRRSRGSEKRD